MDHLKGSREDVAGEALTSMCGFAPAVLLSLGAWRAGCLSAA